jgi:hypothetical protein
LVDKSKKQGRKIASLLCHWSIFVDRIDDENRDLLLAIASYADEDYNSYELIESIADLSESQPFEAHKILMKMLEGSSQDYPEEKLYKILVSLAEEGQEGLRKAKEVVSKYIEKGNDRPSSLLNRLQDKNI